MGVKTLVTSFGQITGEVSDNSGLSSDFDSIKSSLAYLTLDNMMLTGAVVKQYDQQAQDLFVDESGVATKTNLTYDVSKNHYSPTPAASGTLLIQSEATDGITTFTDTIGGKAITRQGDTQHDTSQFKFGTSSIQFDGTGDSLTLADSDDWHFGDGDFTIDFWWRSSNVGVAQDIIGNFGTAGNYGWLLQATSTPELIFYHSVDGTALLNPTTTSSGLTNNAWHHIAIARSSGTLRIFVNGVVKYSGASSANIYNAAADLIIGKNVGGGTIQACHMEEIRIHKGTATWNAAFTPPTSAYDTTPPNVAFVSDPFTATSSPTKADIYALVSFTTGSVSDLTLEARREGASSYATGSVVDTGFDFYDINTSETYNILKVNDIDLSLQTYGTAPQIKLTSLNGINFYFKGWLMQWL